jgi:hypothetical protein
MEERRSLPSQTDISHTTPNERFPLLFLMHNIDINIDIRDSSRLCPQPHDLSDLPPSVDERFKFEFAMSCHVMILRVADNNGMTKIHAI